MRALQFTADRGPGAYHTTYSRQFRAKTYTKRNFLHLMKIYSLSSDRLLTVKYSFHDSRTTRRK
jgi:hypothetical protein